MEHIIRAYIACFVLLRSNEVSYGFIGGEITPLLRACIPSSVILASSTAVVFIALAFFH